MNFILIGSHAPKNQTRLLLLFENGTFAQNMVLRPTSSSAVTMATIHLPIQIWLFLFIPQGNLPPHFASLSWRIALKNLLIELYTCRTRSIKPPLSQETVSSIFRSRDGDGGGGGGGGGARGVAR